jgi:UDP-GlcNAc:undecaprenyl-phosphate GlcNAc-1-phosphate transferase
MWVQGVGIYSLGTWFGLDLTLGIFALPFSMFAIAGFTNALNLIDGMDGLSASISIVILGFFAYIGFEHTNALIIDVSLFTVAGLIGFLMLNWNPAKIFMGDSGSLSLGFIISILSVLSLEYIHPIVILYLGAIPILDTLVVMTRRIREGSSPFKADKTHFHHALVKTLEQFNLTEKSKITITVLSLATLQFLFSAVGYVFSNLIIEEPFGIIPLLALLGFSVLFAIFYKVTTKRLDSSFHF